MPVEIEVEVVLAWPRRHRARRLRLAEGATVADAVAAAALEVAEPAAVVGYAVHGLRVAADTRLRDGDRIELLRPLQADPKEARRRRAAGTGRRA